MVTQLLDSCNTVITIITSCNTIITSCNIIITSCTTIVTSCNTVQIATRLPFTIISDRTQSLMVYIAFNLLPEAGDVSSDESDARSGSDQGSIKER